MSFRALEPATSEAETPRETALSEMNGFETF